MAEEVKIQRPSQRREWFWRALFESGLIVLSILGAFAVNEWQAGRDREARVESVMAAIRAELESNLKLLQDASIYNSEVVAKLKQLGAENAKSIPPEVHPRGLMVQPQLISAAWTSAQAGGTLNELPVETVLILGRAYENQQVYAQETSRLLDIIFATLLQSPSKVFGEPLLLGGILSDYAGRGKRLIARYEKTLAHLRDSGHDLP